MSVGAPPNIQTQQPVYEITDQDRKRQQAIIEAWKAFDSEFDDQLEKTPEGINPNVVINMCESVADTGSDFLFGQELEISVEKNAPAEAQQILDTVWGKKEARIPLLIKLFLNGAMGRNAFLRIVPNTDTITRATTYRLIAVDPAIICVRTAPQDCETVLLYCLQYSETEPDPDTGKPREVWYREEIQRIDPDGNAKRGQPDSDDTWSIQHWTQIGQVKMEPRPGNWVPAGPPILWNYPFPPIFQCQNMLRPNEFWGRADIRPAIINMNKSLNLDMSCMMLSEVIFGNPIIYGTGIGSAPLERRAGYIIPLEIPDAKIAAVAIPSGVHDGLEIANDLRSSIDEASGVPGVATGRLAAMPHGQLPGITVQLMFMSLLKQTDKKRCLYGKLIIDVSKALLVLNGLSGDIDVTLGWQSALPHDDLQDIQASIAKKEIGISETTIMREQGYDPEEEFKIKQQEMKNKELLMQMAQEALPAAIPGTPALPNQPLPAKPGAPGQAPQQQQQGGPPQ